MVLVLLIIILMIIIWRIKKLSVAVLPTGAIEMGQIQHIEEDGEDGLYAEEAEEAVDVFGMENDNAHGLFV